MTAPVNGKNTLAGIAFIIVGILAISINDMLFKFMSGDYPLHQMVFIRSLIGIMFTLCFVQLEGGWKILKTNRPVLHLIRGLMIVIANLTFFMALASLPLAEVTAIFFVAPLLITLLSIPILGERVGPLRIAAVIIGFVGVIIMTRPWQNPDDRSVSFWVYMLPLIAALTYSLTQIMTRYLGVASKASAMALYLQLTFIAVSLGFYLIAGDGRYAGTTKNESLIFLLRAWQAPQGRDTYLFLALGLCSGIVGYALAQAYRIANAATIAPFEYTGLAFAVFWGWLIWSELPSPTIWVGIFLIIGSGLFVFLRETLQNRTPSATKIITRR